MKLTTTLPTGFEFSALPKGRLIQALRISNDLSAFENQSLEAAIRMVSAPSIRLASLVQFHNEVAAALPNAGDYFRSRLEGSSPGETRRTGCHSTPRLAWRGGGLHSLQPNSRATYKRLGSCAILLVGRCR